jgi:cysteine-rich secretory family protein
MVRLWASEKRDYRPGIFPANSRSGDVENVGHYTQMIWRQSRQVGCATAVGRHEEFLVCRYSAAGNVYGERPA